jgi:hypothetical protein
MEPGLILVILTFLAMLFFGWWSVEKDKEYNGSVNEEIVIEKPTSIEPTKDQCYRYLLPINNSYQVTYQNVNWALEKEGLPGKYVYGHCLTYEEFRFCLAVLRRQCKKLLKEKYSE